MPDIFRVLRFAFSLFRCAVDPLPTVLTRPEPPLIPDHYGDPYPVVFSRQQQSTELDLLADIRFRMLFLRYAKVGKEWSTDRPQPADGFHHLHLVCGGRAELVWDSGRLALRPNHAYWLPAHMVARPVCHTFYEHYWLLFRCEWFEGIDLFWDCGAPLCLGTWNPEDYVGRWRRPPLSLGECWRVQCLVERLFAGSSKLLETAVLKQRNLLAKFSQAVTFLEQRPYADTHVRDLAKAQFLTPNAFCRSFHAHFGISPKKYINRRINQEACQMLLTTDLAMKQIAHQLHFADEYYFNRFFRKMNRIPPAGYRKRLRPRAHRGAG